ncbi:sulfotransferase [Salisaeta longa]|uniref:sulfotransferase n=1 Tax=Salisaeta longa TaxID=503170 RepID=UPI0003B2F8A7|nr:sulfotransferase [Salisaeta longa]
MVRSFLQSLVQPVVRRISPVWWANVPGLRGHLARAYPPAQPPLLLMGFPRSGTTWVADVIGRAPELLYLQEPVTQSRPAGRYAVEDKGRGEAPAYYARWADRAFAGVPAFSTNIVRRPRQWRIGARAHRRVFVKEVHPLALRWYAGRYQPQVIYLVRHPAAVAYSFRRLGWTRQPRDAYVHPSRQAQYPPPPRDTFWARMGYVQGVALRAAMEVVHDRPEATVLRYEAVCATPEAQFRAVYDAAGLSWTPAARAGLAERITTEQPGGTPFGTARDLSAHNTERWRDEVPQAAQEALRTAFLAVDPPLYTAEAW